MRLLLSFFIATFLYGGSSGNISVSCDPCSLGQTVIISGKAAGGKNRNNFYVVIFGELDHSSMTYADCTISGNGDFSCTTTALAVGSFNLAAVQNLQVIATDLLVVQ